VSASHRHYSGVLVSADPARLEQALAALAALDGVEVHRIDAETARLVVVLESDDRDGQERLFRTLAALPDVRSADLAYHWIDTEPGADPPEKEAP